MLGAFAKQEELTQHNSKNHSKWSGEDAMVNSTATVNCT